MSKKKKDTTRRSVKSDSTVATSKSQDTHKELDQFREDLKKEIIDIISPKIDDGFDRMFEKLGKQFVSREEYEHEQKTPTSDHIGLPANTNTKMPDLSGLADMVTNILPSQSPSQDTASPQDQTQVNPMGNMMGNPLIQMLMQSIMKPDQPQGAGLFNPATMQELAMRMVMDNMTLQSTINKAFMQKIAGQGADVLATHDHLMSPLTKLGEKSKQAEQLAKIEELKEKLKEVNNGS